MKRSFVSALFAALMTTALPVSAGIPVLAEEHGWLTPDDPGSLGSLKQNIAEGTFGTSNWSIDRNGVLTVTAGEVTRSASDPVPWAANSPDIKAVKADHTVKITGSAARLFEDCGFSSIDLSNWDFSEVTDMSSMFKWCDSLTSISLAGWNTAKVTSMNSMFNYCTALRSADFTGLRLDALSDTSYMFSELCFRSAGIWNLYILTLQERGAYLHCTKCLKTAAR